MPTLQICQDDQVIWHFYSNGAFNDGYHSAHSHGNNWKNSMGSYTGKFFFSYAVRNLKLIYFSLSLASVPLLPAVMTTLTMNAANVGLWQLLCHVADHAAQVSTFPCSNERT